MLPTPAVKGARTRWFDAVSDLSGILHAFCYNETDNRFSYMTNGPSPMGDVNEDDLIDPKDLTQVLKILTVAEPGQPVTTDADVNQDHRLGIEEMFFILQKISSD